MSDYIETDESKICLVIRKPQEGKTFICIANITIDRSNNIHIVLTMNTLAAGMQLFGRMEESIGSKRIIVFNSKKQTAGNCHHARNIDEIFALLRKYPDIKVIVCCAHEKRFRESIPMMLSQSTDSIAFRELDRKFIIHIDEAHVYIPQNREDIRKYNQSDVVASITGYSGSPDDVWSINNDDPLFSKILIYDVENELGMIRSPYYFGVNRCKFHIIQDEIDVLTLIESAHISTEIPEIVVERSGMTARTRKEWHGTKSRFSLGNELLFLSYISYILPRMSIAQEGFSYHFIPAYMRKATQYQTVDIILSIFTNANIIVNNGNGTVLYRLHPINGKSYVVKTDKQIIPKDVKHIQLLLEPSVMIRELIADTQNCPTFVTGFTCVGMSITLIDEVLGNFDSVIMAHQHLSSAKLYQLCRFLFNYTSWSSESREHIKQTKFYSLTREVVDICLEYEIHVERMSTEFSGKVCSLREINGLEPLQPSKREERKKALQSIVPINHDEMWKKFKVYDGNDDEIWANVYAYYSEKTGKILKGKSHPENQDGYWLCSDTVKKDKQPNSSIKKMTTNHSWYSMIQSLSSKKLSYTRVFVGYDSLEDASEYTIYIKHVLLPESALDILEKYGKQQKPAKIISAVVAEGCFNSDDDSDDDSNENSI